MRVLVTGASSLLASRTIDRLLDIGHDVVGLHRSATPNDRYRAIGGNVTDPTAVDDAVRGCHAVVHAAARVGVVGTQAQFAETNITGTAVLLQRARAAGVERFVHVSTPSVAHAGEAIMGAGADPAIPTTASSHYSWSKAVSERQALAADADGFAVVAVRPHLVWGPGDTQLVGRIVDRARAGRLAFVGSGLALVDSTFVDNAADALAAAVDRAPEIAGRALVVSNGQPRIIWIVLRVM